MCVPGPERADGRLVDPVAAVLDDERGHDEVDGDERRQDERVAPRKEHEERGRGERDRERGPAHLLEVDQVVLRPPPRHAAQKVSLSALVVMKRAYGMKTGRTPATTAAATSGRARRA